MTELSKNLGIELEDFLIETGDLTDEQINQILYRCVTLGAAPFEFKKGYKGDCDRVYGSHWGFAGLVKNKTTLEDLSLSTPVLELNDVLDMLQLKPMYNGAGLSYIPQEDSSPLLSMGTSSRSCEEDTTYLHKLDIEIEVLERTLSSLKSIRGNLK